MAPFDDVSISERSLRSDEGNALNDIGLDDVVCLCCWGVSGEGSVLPDAGGLSGRMVGHQSPNHNPVIVENVKIGWRKPYISTSAGASHSRGRCHTAC